MQRTPLSIRIIFILSSVVYYLSAVICSLGVILALVIATGFLNNGLQLHVDMPVEVNFAELGTYSFNDETMNVQIVEAIGKAHLIDTPPKLARWLAVFMVVAFSLLFWLVFLFHRFIRNVREGRIFEKRNFQILRKLGYSLLGLWLYLVVYMQAFNYLVVRNFNFAEVEITSNARWFGGVLIGGLFTLVLAHVFLKGRELEIENELTI